ncbi:PD-(D/E)XK nuclease family protein [Thiocystis violacea]|uniref:PD-(D/E)XK nuclease family protein n=1 Tax=Thiocystis violacea TaxID=13725 RepID=UPI00190733B8|nr:DUF3782 domain-containing protein [Thiocystis violacea]MBK1721604.1 hypothetical protein [Thiocystis violacea]
MNTEMLKEEIKRELPGLLRDDPAFRAFVLDVTRSEYAGRAETQDRFWEVLAELRRDREEQARKWNEQKAEDKRKWDEQARKWDEQARKWDEQKAEDKRNWDEQKAEDRLRWDEQRLKWERNQDELLRLHEEIMAQSKKVDRSIGALGARWGLQSERAFRDALASILEESFGVQVINVNEIDTTGEVFGRPDQVELDVIVKNGQLLICELKSSIDKAGMYSFERKARFYERLHNRKADRLIVISPMIDPRALKVAAQLGIETFGDSLDITGV